MFSESCSFKWTLEAEDFSFFKRRIYELAGISFREIKADLVSSRLRKRATQLGFRSLRDYRLHVENLPDSAPEWQLFINLLTTNKTDFFREQEHFDYLIREFLPEWKKSGKTKLNVWSCASSTGEEPYTIAMVLEKHLGEGHDFSILASDIDTEVLAHAKNGVYSKRRLHEIPDEYHPALAFGSGDVADWFTVKRKIREKIHFIQYNLMSKDLPSEEKFDLVFCRNVLIYFNSDGIEKTAKKIYASTSSEGVLLVGHSESLQGKKGLWKMKRPSYYMKK